MKTILKLCRVFEKFALEQDNPFLLSTKESLDLNEKFTEEQIEEISKYKKDLGNDFWIKFLEMAEDISPTKTNEATMKVAHLIAQVIRGESGFNPKAVAKNKRTGNPIL